MADLKEARFLEELRRDISKIDKEVNLNKRQNSKNVFKGFKKTGKAKKISSDIELNEKDNRLKLSNKTNPTLHLKTESEIAMDFATKAYQNFNKIVKSVILFGSAAKKTQTPGSDIDIIIIVDDASIRWNQELIAWYREELEKIVQKNPYKKNLHINTIKLTTWWDDLIRGDPVVVNIIRDGEALIDFGGFFEPLKYLLSTGRIKSTPEAIYSLLQRAPQHISRSKIAELNVVEGLFWSMVDSSHAALIAAKISPPSPEHIPIALKENFVDTGKLKMKYVIDYRDMFMLHKRISHGEITDLKGVPLDQLQEKAEDFLSTMARLVDSIIS
ncbi:nucleotidyltransferase domain-containing protein [Candidatus Pacearchaeota archaeon]|nr:nucleotidyltransferase domain-containing protein [Candidatus Pacearchaeota archaeon]